MDRPRWLFNLLATSTSRLNSLQKQRLINRQVSQLRDFLDSRACHCVVLFGGFIWFQILVAHFFPKVETSTLLLGAFKSSSSLKVVFCNISFGTRICKLSFADFFERHACILCLYNKRKQLMQIEVALCVVWRLNFILNWKEFALGLRFVDLIPKVVKTL